jgi:hypothetical protein
MQISILVWLVIDSVPKVFEKQEDFLLAKARATLFVV